jgi:hypothetical protein
VKGEAHGTMSRAGGVRLVGRRIGAEGANPPFTLDKEAGYAFGSNPPYALSVTITKNTQVP